MIIDQPHMHLTIREIARDIVISKSSVHNIGKKDLRLKCLKKKRAQELTSANKPTRLIRAKQLNSTKPLVSTKCYDNSLTLVKLGQVIVYKIFNKSLHKLILKILVETTLLCSVT